MTHQNTELENPSFWQLVFLQSKVNGARYTGEWLASRSWKWPENTYLQRRLKQLRQYRLSGSAGVNQLAA